MKFERILLFSILVGATTVGFQNCSTKLNPPNATGAANESNNGSNTTSIPKPPAPSPSTTPTPTPSPAPFIFQNKWKALTASNPPPALFAHTAISTGSKIIVWGGNNSLTTLAPSGGYVLDLATNAWSALSGTGGPTARRSHTAVWTGQTMIIWGGLINDSTGATTNDGGIYNPQTATWTAIPAFGLTARAGHVAVWTGTEMIVWGGFDSANNALGDGGIYNPATNAWRAMSSTGAPSARKHPVAIWTGSKMLIWGGANADGSVPVGDGAYYDPVADKWTPLTQTTPPSPRQWMSFDLAPVNNALYIFGGFTTGAVGSGYTLDLGSGLWSAISTTGAPSARYGHSQVMTSQGMVIWGGTDGTNVFQDGAIYY